MEPSLPNFIRTPRTQPQANSSENVFTIEDDSNENNVTQNQSNSYLYRLSNSKTGVISDDVPIPDRWSNLSSFKAAPLAMTQSVYPPTKIPGGNPTMSNRLDPTIRHCCIFWVVIGGIFIILDIIIIGIVAYGNTASDCCDVSINSSVIGISIALGLYFLASVFLFSEVHGGELESSPNGECKEIALKVINIIILIIFICLIFWTNNSNIPIEKCRKVDEEMDCPRIVKSTIVLWFYTHAFILFFRLAAVLIMPHTRIRDDSPLDFEIRGDPVADPDLRRIIESIKSQRRVMDFPSATKSIVARQLSSDDNF